MVDEFPAEALPRPRAGSEGSPSVVFITVPGVLREETVDIVDPVLFRSTFWPRCVGEIRLPLEQGNTARGKFATGQ